MLSLQTLFAPFVTSIDVSIYPVFLEYDRRARARIVLVLLIIQKKQSIDHTFIKIIEKSTVIQSLLIPYNLCHISYVQSSRSLSS